MPVQRSTNLTTWPDMDSHLPQLASLIETRLLLVRNLADSLDVSRSALLANDAEAIARGAAHQAELCRQWSRLEDQIRLERVRSPQPSPADTDSPAARQHLRRLEDEWAELSGRIRHLTRVHVSLLRHLNRSLSVLARIAESCEPTYSPGTGVFPIDSPARAEG